MNTEYNKYYKMCYFGAALSIEENDIIKYILYHFYHFLELLIGYLLDTRIDAWSIGIFVKYALKIFFFMDQQTKKC